MIVSLALEEPQDLTDLIVGATVLTVAGIWALVAGLAGRRQRGRDSVGRHEHRRGVSLGDGKEDDWRDASRRLLIHHLNSRFHRVPRYETTATNWRGLALRHQELHRDDRGILVAHFYWTPTFVYPNPVANLAVGAVLAFPLALLGGVIAGIVDRSFLTGLIWAGFILVLGSIVSLIWATIRAIRLMYTQPKTKNRYEELWSEYEEGGYTGDPFSLELSWWPNRPSVFYLRSAQGGSCAAYVQERWPATTRSSLATGVPPAHPCRSHSNSPSPESCETSSFPASA